MIGRAHLTHRVPLGVHLLLLKLGELSAVMDNHEKLPDEQQGQADQNDASDHARHDGDDVGPFRAAWSGQDSRVAGRSVIFR